MRYYVAAMSCLLDEEVHAFLAGTLAADALARVDAHLDRCADCRELVAAVARATTSGALLEPNTAFGRYILLSPIGAGGMGVVYAAYDPDLDRKIALKLVRLELREGPDADDARARLLREARAMAKVAHQNVISVFEAGTVDELVFIAMEYVDGGTLSSWLKDQQRSPQEIAAAFVQAGRGLAAAHAEQIIHRDFKPENVLVGADHRMRVTDFGLAHAAGEAAVAGAIFGTPAYMAPEQYRGEKSDARTDQYNFAVSLWESLYGVRPFKGRSVEELEAAVIEGRVDAPPPDVKVPAGLERSIKKAMSVRPEDRFATMDALLAALEAELAPPPRKNRAAIALSFGVVLAAVLGTVAYVEHRNQLCSDAEKKIALVWSPEKKELVRAAFAKVNSPEHEKISARVAAMIDAYAEAWSKERREVCEATRIHKSQSEERLDVQMSCLDRRLGELGALVELYAEADAKIVNKSIEASHALGNPKQCATANLSAVSPAPKDAAESAAFARVQAKLDRAGARNSAGKYKDVLVLAEEARKEAAELGNKHYEGKALLRLGSAQMNAGDLPGAEKTLREAVMIAHAAGDDSTVSSAASDLMSVIAFQRTAEEARTWGRLASASIERLGPDPLLSAKLALREGELLQREGKPKEAYAAYESACSAREAINGREHPSLSPCLIAMSMCLIQTGSIAESIDVSERTVAILKKSYGDDHSSLAWPLTNLGAAYAKQSRLQDAMQQHQAALAIWTKSLGEKHALVGHAIGNIASVLLELGEHQRALAEYERAYILAAEVLGPDHAIAAEPLTGKADVLRALGRNKEAIELYRRALAILDKSPGDAELHARALYGAALSLVATDRNVDALPLIKRAEELAPKIDPARANEIRALGKNL